MESSPNGTGHALIGRGKIAANWQARVAYLSRERVKWVKIWLDHAKIEEGPMLQLLICADWIGGGFYFGGIVPIFKRVAQSIRLPERFVAEVNWRSTSVWGLRP